MRILSLLDHSIHPVIVHDGIRIFRANQLALALFRYASVDCLAAGGIASLIAEESRWLSVKRVEKLRKYPDVDLPDAELMFVRRDGSKFTATIHTRTLRWAFLEERDLLEVKEQLHTDIVFYSWIDDKDVIDEPTGA